MKLICISDTHNRHKELQVPDGDIIIHAGDFTEFGTEQEVQDFRDWFVTLPHPHKILIAGNHDICLDLKYDKDSACGRFHGGQTLNFEKIKSIITESEDIIYLENESVEIMGCKFWGSPYQPEFGNWAFNLKPPIATLENAKKIPTDTDILITHGPPYGHGDKTSYGTFAGCNETLSEVTDRVKPILHVFGHIHSGYGISKNENTMFVNASSVGEYDEPLNKPLIITF